MEGFDRGRGDLFFGGVWFECFCTGMNSPSCVTDLDFEKWGIVLRVHEGFDRFLFFGFYRQKWIQKL